MKGAYINGEMVHVDGHRHSEERIRELVNYYGAVCPGCGKEVTFCSGPKKGQYFAHLERSENCHYYHESEQTSAPKVKAGIEGIYQRVSAVVGRKLKSNEKELIQIWLYHDSYQESEIVGVLSEIVAQKTEDGIFSKADSRLFAITRGNGENPYFQKLK